MFLPHFLSSSGWTNNQFIRDGSSGESDQLITCVHMGFPRNVRPEDTLSIEAYMPFWTKEREAEVWDFKEKVGS